MTHTKCVGYQAIIRHDGIAEASGASGTLAYGYDLKRYYCCCSFRVWCDIVSIWLGCLVARCHCCAKQRAAVVVRSQAMLLWCVRALTFKKPF